MPRCSARCCSTKPSSGCARCSSSGPGWCGYAWSSRARSSYKGEDALARDHFDRVLAGDVPESVAVNVRGFLTRIRARRRWNAYLGMSIVPDSNISGASDSETIFLNIGGVDLPFQRNQEDLATSGVGAQIWTGGEYQHPAGSRLRLRAGVNAACREYAGGQFDETNLAIHAGPRWLIDQRTEASLLGSVRRRWAAGEIDYDAGGVRLQARRRLTPRFLANVRGSWERRLHRENDHLDGPVTGRPGGRQVGDHARSCRPTPHMASGANVRSRRAGKTTAAGCGRVCPRSSRGDST